MALAEEIRGDCTSFFFLVGGGIEIPKMVLTIGFMGFVRSGCVCFVLGHFFSTKIVCFFTFLLMNALTHGFLPLRLNRILEVTCLWVKTRFLKGKRKK